METRKPNDPRYLLDRILPHVLNRADLKSELRREAVAYDAACQTEEGPGWGVTSMFGSAWLKTPAIERRRIGNGWLWDNKKPTAAAVTAWTMRDDVEIEEVLWASCAPEGAVGLYKEWRATEGNLSPVEIMVRWGTDKATMMAAGHALLAALEMRFDAVAGMRVSDHVTVAAGDVLEAKVQGVQGALDDVAKAFDGVQAAVAAMGMPAKGEEGGEECYMVERIFADTNEGKAFRERLLEALRLHRDNAWSADDIVEETLEMRGRAYAAEEREINSRRILAADLVKLVKLCQQRGLSDAQLAESLSARIAVARRKPFKDVKLPKVRRMAGKMPAAPKAKWTGGKDERRSSAGATPAPKGGGKGERRLTTAAVG